MALKTEDSSEYIDYTKMADVYIKQMAQIAAQMIKGSPAIVSAIVDSVNSDGSVNVYFPPDNGVIISGIMNESIHQDLVAGNSVMVMKPYGTLTNCWICAKNKT